MQTVDEIYHLIGSCITEQIKKAWTEATLNIELTEGVVGYNGGYQNTEGAFESFSVRDFPRELRNNLKELHQITTDGGNNRWNRAIFKLRPEGKFDMEFIWDQELHDEIERLNK